MLLISPQRPFRLPLSVSLLISLASQMIWWSSPAEAQGFFQQLFGLSPAPQVQSRPRPPMPGASISGAPMRFAAPTATGPRRPGMPAPEGSGSYTTVCVRMCDGFYFPVSHRVPRSRFRRDADICRERCPSSEARLFYHSSARGSMRDAVDLTGRAYARLPIAFRHRKELVRGCGCKPEPWSVEALSRHEGYAIAAGLYLPGRSPSGGPLTVIAGSYPDAPAPDRSEPQAGDPATPDAVAVTSPAPDDSAAADRAVASRTTDEPSLASQTDADPAQPPRIMAASKPTRARGLKPPARRPMRQASTQTRPLRAKTAAVGSSGGLVWPGDSPSRTR